MHEFNLIEEYFTWNAVPSGIAVPVGDDAAVLDIPENHQLVTSIDTLISGVHFPKNTPAHAIGHKALAVNLSDLAAMGATPKWFTLALTLPEIEQTWLESFSRGLKEIAQKHQCFLVGGDTTRGPLSISIQVMGVVEKDKALLRSGAKSDDKIYVTGTLGDAVVGLHTILNDKKHLIDVDVDENDKNFCQKRLNYPTPRLAQSQIIKELASSCIDISDGLLQDLSHILKSSNKGARLDLPVLPLSMVLQKLEKEEATNFALSGGDDYELLFTIPKHKEAELKKALGSDVSCIGVIDKNINKITDLKGNELTIKGYNHFNDK